MHKKKQSLLLCSYKRSMRSKSSSNKHLWNLRISAPWGKRRTSPQRLEKLQTDLKQKRLLERVTDGSASFSVWFHLLPADNGFH